MQKEYLSAAAEVLSDQGVDENLGLSNDEASSRLAKTGPNKLEEAEKTPLWKRFFEQMADPMVIMLIVAAASTFSWILTKERIPQALTAWMLANIHSKYVFLIVVNIFLLIVGMFIEGNASMIILVPLLAPIAAQYGINEIQFAMIYIFNNAIGALSPPMGTLMFVTCSITKCKTAAFIKEAVPFYILLIINLMLLTWVEPFTTFLVNLFY